MSYTHPLGDGSIMIGGYFCYWRRGYVIRFMYTNILYNNLLPHIEETLLFGNVYQQDNNPKHKSKIMTEWLKDQTTNDLPWPMQPPDINTTENMRVHVDNQLDIKILQIKLTYHCNLIISKEYMDLSYIQKMVEIMSRGRAKIIKQKEYHM